MAIIFIRTLIVFVVLLALMRLMGKRQIGEMQPYELVITLIIADLACIPMSDVTTPLLYGLVALLSVYFLHQVICLIDIAIPRSRAIISGSPSVVINKNGIDDAQLKKNNLNVSDLIESLRGAGYFSLDSVDYALYESSGSFSALPKPDYESTQNSLPVTIVCEGRFQPRNIQSTNRDENYYRKILAEQGYKDVKKVLIMTVDGNGRAYIQNKGERYKVVCLDWEEKVW